MKRLFTILLCLPLVTNAQIEGIGKFKINKSSISIMDSLSQEINREILPSFRDPILVSNGQDLNKPPYYFWELKKDSTGQYISDPSATFNQNVRTFFLSSYTISGINLTGIYFTFFNDTLVKIRCKSSEALVQALKAKYGEPLIKSETKTITCRNGFGATFKHEEKSFVLNWESKIKNISAQETILSWYNSDCELQYLDVFEIMDNHKMFLLDKQNIEIEDAIKLRRDKIKSERLRETLKDF